MNSFFLCAAAIAAENEEVSLGKKKLPSQEVVFDQDEELEESQVVFDIDSEESVD